MSGEARGRDQHPRGSSRCDPFQERMTEGLCQGLKEVARPQQRWWVKAPGRGEVSTGAEASQPSGEKVSSLGRGAARWSFGEGRWVPLGDDCGPAPLDSRVRCALHSFPLAPRPPWLTLAGLESPPPGWSYSRLAYVHGAPGLGSSCRWAYVRFLCGMTVSSFRLTRGSGEPCSLVPRGCRPLCPACAGASVLLS